MRVSYLYQSLGAVVALCLSTGLASAAGKSPVGTWIDHTGRGAVEIKPCGKKLCGHVVWARSKKDSKKGCGKKIIGNLKKINSKTWDRGWIYSPERGRKFDLEVKPVGSRKLRILGYMGNKMFSKTMYWKRAPSDLVRCDQPDVKADTPIIAKKTKQSAEQPPKKKLAKAATEPKATPPAPQIRAAAIVPPKPIRAAREAEAAKPQEDPPKVVASRDISSDPVAGAKKKSPQDVVDDYQNGVDSNDGTDGEVVEDRPVPERRTARYKKKKRCTISAPFVTVSFPCKK